MHRRILSFALLLAALIPHANAAATARRADNDALEVVKLCRSFVRYAPTPSLPARGVVLNSSTNPYRSFCRSN